jgi:thioredoxin reductase (NADPH)
LGKLKQNPFKSNKIFLQNYYMEHTKCLIIGSGPAGYTAAIYASRANLSPVLYQGMQPGGQLTTTSDVENFPGYPEGVTGPEMMVDLQKQAERFGASIRYGMVTKVDFEVSPKRIWIDDTQEMTADTVIISTGASAKWLGLPAEQKFNGLGVSACAVCDGFFYRNQEVAVVGGGDTAAEEASYLANLCSKVHLLVRRDVLRASQIMQNRVLNNPKIEVHWNTETLDLVGDKAGLTGAIVRNTQTNEESNLNVTGFFVAIGHQPNTDIFKGFLDMDDVGYIKTKAGSTRTNVEGVFASGDAQDNIYRQAITAAGTGCMAALDAERFLAENELI